MGSRRAVRGILATAIIALVCESCAPGTPPARVPSAPIAQPQTQPPSRARPQPRVEPAATDTSEEDAPEAMLEACRAATLLTKPRGWKPAKLTAKQPLLAVRYVVPDRELDYTKGEGEIGFSGGSRAFDARVIDMRTSTFVGSERLGACFEFFVRAPRAGELCVVVPYDDDPRKRPLTFEYDFASRMHYRATESAYQDGACKTE